jgi:AcrR family transcriptional regulator
MAERNATLPANKMEPTGNLREKQKAATRELILDSARALFETEGFKKTTMRRVAVRAGIGLGTTYKHFKNKAALLIAALLDDLTRLYAATNAKMPTDRPLRQQLVEVARPFYEYYISRPALTRAYLTNLFTLDDEALAPINDFDEAYAENIALLVEQAQRRGEISPDKNSALVAMAFMADYFFILVTCFLRYNETDPEKMLSLLDNLLEQTIA